jgi:hypothetical protein
MQHEKHWYAKKRNVSAISLYIFVGRCGALLNMRKNCLRQLSLYFPQVRLRLNRTREATPGEAVGSTR